jgi:hypothetical protein
MPRVSWPLLSGRPVIEVIATLAQSGQSVRRILLADTGAGPRHANFDLVLEANDCLLCGGRLGQPVVLGGAYTGSFPSYLLRIQIPALGFDHDVRVVGVPSPPAGLDGIACFRFLCCFTYGNFGNPGEFGIEA